MGTINFILRIQNFHVSVSTLMLDHELLFYKYKYILLIYYKFKSGWTGLNFITKIKPNPYINRATINSG